MSIFVFKMNDIKLIEINDTEWTKIEGLSSRGKRVKSWYENNKTNEIYLYKEPKIYQSTGVVTKEIWTELIAYKLGTIFGLDIPKAIPATNGKDYGILIKSFLSQENSSGTEIALAEAREILNVTNFKLYHNLKTISFLLNGNLLEKDSWTKFKQMLIFDCIIGNNDRHDENWGILYGSALEKVKLSPIYDNASCLTYGDDETKVLELLTNENKFEKYINSSKPPNLYLNENDGTHYKHFEIIKYLIKEEPETIELIRDMVKIDCLSYTKSVLEQIAQIEVPEVHKLTKNREKLIIKILDFRINKLKDIVNVHY